MLVARGTPVLTQHSTRSKLAIESRQKNAVDKSTQRRLIVGEFVLAIAKALVQQINGALNDLAGPGRRLCIRQSQREHRNERKCHPSKHIHPHLKLLFILATTIRRPTDQELAYYILKQEG